MTEGRAGMQLFTDTLPYYRGGPAIVTPAETGVQ